MCTRASEVEGKSGISTMIATANERSSRQRYVGHYATARFTRDTAAAAAGFKRREEEELGLSFPSARPFWELLPPVKGLLPLYLLAASDLCVRSAAWYTSALTRLDDFPSSTETPCGYTRGENRRDQANRRCCFAAGDWEHARMDGWMDGLLKSDEIATCVCGVFVLDTHLKQNQKNVLLVFTRSLNFIYYEILSPTMRSSKILLINWHFSTNDVRIIIKLIELIKITDIPKFI